MLANLQKPRARALEKADKRRAILVDRRETYRLIEQRDGMHCRACNCRVVKTTEMRLDQLQHHHVRGRGGNTSEHSSNLALLCRKCHDERHVARTLHIAGNADELLTFQRGQRTWRG